MGADFYRVDIADDAEALVPAKSIDENVYKLIEPLIHRGDERFEDVMEWLTAEEKKKRPGNKS